MSKPNALIAEFLAWYCEVSDGDVINVFDAAYGFYFGRHPDRSEHLGLTFANKARDFYEQAQLAELDGAR